MCGRLSIETDPRAWMNAFGAVFNAEAFEGFEARYNVSPSEPPLPEGSKRTAPRRMTEVPIVLERGDERVAENVTWPMIPVWAKGEVPQYSTANARSESMAEKPAYRHAWSKGQRCLIYATGFFEWQAVAGEKGKQPWYIHLANNEPLILGGLWERSRRSEDEWVSSCTIVTLPANPFMREIHNAGKNKHRMPLILDGVEKQAAWLGTDVSDAVSLIKPVNDDALEAWKVSRAVNNPSSDKPELVAAIFN